MRSLAIAALACALPSLAQSSPAPHRAKPRAVVSASAPAPSAESQLAQVVASAPAAAPDLTVLGLRLNVDLLKQFKPCDLGDDWRHHTGLCFVDGPAGILIDVGEGVSVPTYIRNGDRWRAVLAAGKLEGLSFPTHSFMYDQIHAALVKKYGAPTSTTPRTVHNRMGASYEAVTERWEFSDLRVTYDSIWGDLDQGRIEIVTPAGIAEMARKEQAKRDAEPGL